MTTTEKIKKIKDYYQQAWKCIKENNFKEANKIIFEHLGIELYDISLDIHYNYSKKTDKDDKSDLNDYIVNKRLRQLIRKVTRILNKEQEDKSEDKLLTLINSEDKKWYLEQEQ